MKPNSLYDIEYFQKIKDAQNHKKKMLKRRRMFLLALVALFVVYLFSPLSRINSVVVDGDNRYTVSEIKAYAQLDEKQFTFLKPSFITKRRLTDTNLFTDVKVKKSLFGNVKIELVENKLLFYTIENNKIIFYDEQNNKILFDDVKSRQYQGLIPSLSNKLNDEIKNKLVDKLKLLDQSVLTEISQIIYTPKSYDKEFFRFVMSGKQEIYLNASLDHIVKVGSNYHNFAANTKYHCSSIEYLDTENKAIVKKCK